MHLEPVEIQHVKLRRRLLGYDREAVDRLLERVTASYEDTWFERRTLESELASLRNKLDGQAMAKEALQGSVQVAQSTADDLLAEAHVRARQVLDEANKRAAETIGDAEAEYQRLKLEIRKLEVSETEITLRLRSLLTAARELLDGHESIRQLAAETSGGDPSRTESPGPIVYQQAAQDPAANEPPGHDPHQRETQGRMDQTLQQQAARTAAAPERSATLAVESPATEPVPATAPRLQTEPEPTARASVPTAPAAAAAATAALTAARESDAPASEPGVAGAEFPSPVESIPAERPGPDKPAPDRPAPEKVDPSAPQRVGPDPAVASRAAL